MNEKLNSKSFENKFNKWLLQSQDFRKLNVERKNQLICFILLKLLETFKNLQKIKI